jgi:transcriptional regulator with XRE-family HTH domain
MFPPSLSTEIRCSRLIAGFTQAQLAKACGISTSQISRIERGDMIPNANTISTISEALSLDKIAKKRLLASALLSVVTDSEMKDQKALASILIALKTI